MRTITKAQLLACSSLTQDGTHYSENITLLSAASLLTTGKTTCTHGSYFSSNLLVTMFMEKSPFIMSVQATTTYKKKNQNPISVLHIPVYSQLDKMF